MSATNEKAIITIPRIEVKSGLSLLKIIQLKIAPKTGIRNFQKFNIETFMPGRFSNENQIIIAASDKKLNYFGLYDFSKTYRVLFDK